MMRRRALTSRSHRHWHRSMADSRSRHIRAGPHVIGNFVTTLDGVVSLNSTRPIRWGFNQWTECA